jgi:hypothetical protein
MRNMTNTQSIGHDGLVLGRTNGSAMPTNEAMTTMAETLRRDHPPAQHWFKDAVSCTPPLPPRMGWPGAIISGVLPDAPSRPPHTARRRRREARQGEVFSTNRTLHEGGNHVFIETY